MTQPSLHIDFETRSTVELKSHGLWNYSRDPSTDVWCMAHAFGADEPVVMTRDDIEEPNLYVCLRHVETGGRVVAHNANFELAIWNNIMVPRYSWPVLRPEQTYCTMAMAYSMGLPGALEDVALALGLKMLKDPVGRALMLRMSRPRSMTPDGPIWWEDPEKLAILHEYCRQDVRVERELEKRLMPLSKTERKVWMVDYKINQRGVAVDIASAKGATAVAETMKDFCDAEMSRITGGAATTVGSLIPLKAWLAERGLPVESLAKEALADLLDGDLPSEEVREALTIRQEGAAASTAKFKVMANHADDEGRVHNLYQYHGAMSGRWAARGVQVHNLVARGIPPKAQIEHTLELVRAGDHRAIDMLYGPPLKSIGRCSRAFFVAPPGKVLVGGDWSNVEGRGQAWFAGEKWKLDAYRAADEKRGPGLYELAYSRMFNVPVESIKDPSNERQIGKVAELAFGYQGGIGSWITMARSYKLPPTSAAQVNQYKEAWRTAHPRIKSTWYEVEAAALRAVRAPGETFACGFPGRQAYFRVVGSFLWLQLPSKRVICYPYPKILPGLYGDMLTYMTQPSPDDKKKLKIIDDPANASNWARVGTYGGNLYNNIIQGFCSDFLRDLLVRLDDKGAQIVLHTHDDANLETHESQAEIARKALEGMMRTPPAWAKDFPLFAKCKISTRYGT